MKKIFLILLLFLSVNSYSQTERFFKLFDVNKERNYFQGLVELNGNYYASGISNYSGMILFANKLGEANWIKTYKLDSLTAEQTIFTRAELTKDKNGIIISATKLYFDTTKVRGIKTFPGYLKFDLNGNLVNEWFNFEYYDTLNFGQRTYQLPNGNYILGCASYSEDQREQNPSLLIIDSLGIEQLRRDYAIFPNKNKFI